MTFLRSCYYSKFRLYRDRPDILVPGRWRWSSPGAIVVPYLHAFDSSTWDPWNLDQSEGVGEVERGAYYNGAGLPTMNGRRFCGGEEVWRLGGLYDDRGSPGPDCCKATAASYSLDYSSDFDSLNVS